MINDKDRRLAKIFVNHSVKLKPKEKVLITCSGLEAFSLVKATYIEALKVGAYPVIDIAGIDYSLNRSFTGGLRYQFYKLANQWQLNYFPKEIIKAKIDWADAFIRITSISNTKELAQVDPKKITLQGKLMEPYIEKIIDMDRWVLTYFPTPALAQEAGVSLDWFLDFFYRACLVDYQKMKKQLKKLERTLDRGKQVHIIGKETDLTFSIAGRLAQACYGKSNIPDGEVFIAPLHRTLEGKIYFELPTVVSGNEVRDIYLEFKKGQVVKAKATVGNKFLQAQLETDPGARFIGEFGIGVNYGIKRVVKSTLFDEKIGGTIHLALGKAYTSKRGGGTNKSAIHWDLIKDTRTRGSQVKIDNKVVLHQGKIY